MLKPLCTIVQMKPEQHRTDYLLVCGAEITEGEDGTQLKNKLCAHTILGVFGLGPVRGSGSAPGPQVLQVSLQRRRRLTDRCPCVQLIVLQTQEEQNTPSNLQ